MIAIILGILLSLLGASNQDVDVTYVAPAETAEQVEWEWAQFHADSYVEHFDEFERLFNSYEYKLSKNGRSMVNGKFVKMGAPK